MKLTISFMLAAQLLCIAAAPLPALAAADTSGGAGFHNETPLMVIRFNQPHIDYPMPLYNTVAQALKVKPGAVFDIVSVAPSVKDPERQAYYNSVAEHNVHGVLSTLHNIGLPAQRISVVNTVENVETSEVRIFVH